MDSALDFDTSLALLDWQLELGARDAIQDTPVNRYEVPEKQPKAVAKAATEPVLADTPPTPLADDPVAVARSAASQAADLEGLRAAMAAFEHCDLKAGARNLVFADGNPAARVMVIGEAPGRDEDREGRPFVGKAGQLLDRMFGAIGLSRTSENSELALYITNVLPWRPPQNRTPTGEEIAMLTPFLERHVELAAPDVLVVMGNISCQALLGRQGITRLRGNWAEALGRPALPMTHPAYLLRQPHAKREAWADLLSLQARLRSI